MFFVGLLADHLPSLALCLPSLQNVISGVRPDMHSKVHLERCNDAAGDRVQLCGGRAWLMGCGPAPYQARCAGQALGPMTLTLRGGREVKMGGREVIL